MIPQGVKRLLANLPRQLLVTSFISKGASHSTTTSVNYFCLRPPATTQEDLGQGGSMLLMTVLMNWQWNRARFEGGSRRMRTHI
jgi:hypothetical protein